MVKKLTRFFTLFKNAAKSIDFAKLSSNYKNDGSFDKFSLRRN